MAGPGKCANCGGVLIAEPDSSDLKGYCERHCLRPLTFRVPNECFDCPEVVLVLQKVFSVPLRGMELTASFCRAESARARLMGMSQDCAESAMRAGKLVTTAIASAAWRTLTAERLRHLVRHDTAAFERSISHLGGESAVREQLGNDFPAGLPEPDIGDLNPNAFVENLRRRIPAICGVEMAIEDGIEKCFVYPCASLIAEKLAVAEILPGMANASVPLELKGAAWIMAAFRGDGRLWIIATKDETTIRQALARLRQS